MTARRWQWRVAYCLVTRRDIWVDVAEHFARWVAARGEIVRVDPPIVYESLRSEW